MKIISNVQTMPPADPYSTYDDGNIPKIDFPGETDSTSDIPSKHDNNIPKLDEDERPRQDGPGGA